MPIPYSNCKIDPYSPKFRKDSDLYDLIINSQYMYSQQTCFIQCYQKQVIKKCNCSDSDFLSLFNFSSDCKNQSCQDYFINDEYEYLIKECIPLCLLECTQVLIKASISFVKLKGYKYIEFIKNNPNLREDFINRSIDLSTVKERIVKLNIFYDSLSYTLSTEMDVISLLACIGGTLGLLLGVSVFSLCELIEVAIEIVFIVFKRF